uniref:Uncharacterized protein n=1 Tax=Anguilla anguilla TaxID=7936 RepID=A0A0E9XW61_ANGAN
MRMRMSVTLIESKCAVFSMQVTSPIRKGRLCSLQHTSKTGHVKINQEDILLHKLWTSAGYSV